MKLKYNAQKLQQILEDFTCLTNLSISVVDTDLSPIAQSFSQKNSFCRLIQNTEDGTDRCFCSDKALLKKCSETLTPQLHTCHAGLTDAAVPLLFENKIIGFCLLGQIRQNEQLHVINKNLNWVDSLEALKKEYQNLPFYDNEHLKSAVNLATAITSLILSDKLISPIFDELTDSIVSYIKNNLDGDLSVKAICNKFLISKSKLYEIFRGTVGEAVGQFITKNRIYKAKQLLSETNLSISEIAEKVGMESYTYFIKFFKARVGTTPLQYRKQAKQNTVEH